MYESKEIGAFIARVRVEKGWTQRELAGRIHVTDKAVSKWERGAGYPDISIVPALAGALGVSETELLRGSRLPTAPGEEINGAVRATLAYAAKAQVQGRKQTGLRVFGGGLLALVYAVTICRKADLALNGAITWSGYVLILAGFLLIPLIVACTVRRGALWMGLGAASIAVFPALYLMLRHAGQSAAFWPVGVPVALAGVLILWTIAALMTFQAGGHPRYAALMGGLLVILGIMSDLLIAALSGASFREMIAKPDTFFAVIFVLMMAAMPFTPPPKDLRRL